MRQVVREYSEFDEMSIGNQMETVREVNPNWTVKQFSVVSDGPWGQFNMMYPRAIVLWESQVDWGRAFVDWPDPKVTTHNIEEKVYDI